MGPLTFFSTWFTLEKTSYLSTDQQTEMCHGCYATRPFSSFSNNCVLAQLLNEQRRRRSQRCFHKLSYSFILSTRFTSEHPQQHPVMWKRKRKLEAEAPEAAIFHGSGSGSGSGKHEMNGIFLTPSSDSPDWKTGYVSCDPHFKGECKKKRG